MKVVHYSHQGKRDNQEDAMGFDDQLYYLVCDGVGGHEKGEVASNFVVDYVKQNFPKLDVVNKSSLQELIVNAQKAMNAQLVTQPESLGMGTTFAGVFQTNAAVFVTHLGDSRVYWVRPKSQQIWHTWDHSMVGNLMQMGEISREEGRFHPQGNRISKAIIANQEDKTVKPDIAKITQLEEGDLFLICSDGVTEAWSEYELMEVLCGSSSIQDKLKAIQSRCENDSKDNNTAILLEVDQDSVLTGAPNEEITWLTLDFLKKDYDSYYKVEEALGDTMAADIHAEEPMVLELIEEASTDFTPLPESIDTNSDGKKKIFMALVLIVIALIVFFFVQKLMSTADAQTDGFLILTKENQLYGYQNTSKEWVIPARFVSADPFEDGRAKVATRDSVFYINDKGEMIAFIRLVGEDVSNAETEFGQLNNQVASNQGNAAVTSQGATNPSSQQAATNANNAIDFNELMTATNGASSGFFESAIQIESAFQTLTKKYANTKIPQSEEKKFLDKIRNADTKEEYKKKINKHNSATLTPSLAPANNPESGSGVAEPDPIEM